MKTKAICLLLIAMFAGLAHAGWERTYGGSSWDRGESVAQTSDGGYIVAGYTESFGAGSGDVYLVKTDSVGDTIWTRTYGGSSSDIGNSVAQTSDGGYIVAGYTYSFGAGSGDVYLVKTDAVGDTIWTRTYGGSDDDRGYSIAQTSDGEYIVAGYTNSFGAGSGDVYLVKTDTVGDTIWTRTFGGSDHDYGFSVAQTSDGGYIVAGRTYSFGAGSWDFYLVKTDAVGNTIWTRTYGGSDWDSGESVTQTTDGGYIVAGGTESFGAGYEDVYLVKTDADGDTLWTRTYGGDLWDCGHTIANTTDGGYIVAGYTYSFGVGSGDVYLVKTDAVGDTIWTRTYGGSNDDTGFSFAQTSDGGYIIAGRTYSFGADSGDVYLVKTDSLGFTGIGENPPFTKPEAFALSAYPNPFNSAVKISLSCHSRAIGNPEIEIYDINGRMVKTIPPAPLNKGGARRAGGSYYWRPDAALASGVYLVRATVGANIVSKRVVYLK